MGFCLSLRRSSCYWDHQGTTHRGASPAGFVEHTGIEPEEDVEVRLFDRDFELILSATRSISDARTILLGLRRVAPSCSQHGHRWHLEEERWDGSRAEACHHDPHIADPTISAAEVRLSFFSRGCADFSGPRWYRMLPAQMGIRSSRREFLRERLSRRPIRLHQRRLQCAL